jgi:antirestriction protein ArdC
MTKTAKTAAAKTDVHATITAAIIAAVEANPGAFVMPWHRNAGTPLHMPANALTGKSYNGINVVSLWVAAEARQYQSAVWGTYKQWAELGAQVRKGEKASPVVFYREFEVEANPDDQDDDGKRRVARASSVFNASQVDGYVLPDQPAGLGPVARSDAFAAFVNGTGADIRHGGGEAYYRPGTDHIQMPDEGRFCGTATSDRHQAYMSTLAHELSHWAGAPHRLNREFGKRFGDSAYAAEELVAELTAAFICADLGIANEPRPDHAQYIAQWLRLLKTDSKAIFTAAAKASQAAAYLKSRNVQPVNGCLPGPGHLAAADLALAA